MRAPAATWTKRVAQRLCLELAFHEAQRIAVDIDGGLGQLAMAAIVATPPGPARTVEAARWARRAHETVDQVVVLVEPGGGEDWVNAHAELMVALYQTEANA